jgi:hypothetical protein
LAAHSNRVAVDACSRLQAYAAAHGYGITEHVAPYGQIPAHRRGVLYGLVRLDDEISPEGVNRS